MNPWLTALLGAIAFVVLGFAAVQTTAHRLVDTLREAAQGALARNDVGWASVDMDGQTALLTGAAPSAEAQAYARDLVLAADGAGGPLWGGVIRVEDQTTLGDAMRPDGNDSFVWRAVKVGGTVQMTGSVPSAAVRTALVEKARALFPNNVVDRMEVNGDAPDGDWRGAAMTALESLAQLKMGEARLSDKTLVVRGNSADESVVRAVNDAVRQPASGFSGTGSTVVVAGGSPEEGAVNADRGREGRADDAEAPADAESITTEMASGTQSNGVQSSDGVRKAVSDADEGASAMGSEACQRRLDAVAADSDILFEFGSTRIDGESMALIDQMAEAILSCPAVPLTVAGHSDDQGGEAVNKRISLERANSVVNRLVEIGIDRERLTAEGHGSSRPVAGNETEEGRAQNRRIEINVLQ